MADHDSGVIKHNEHLILDQPLLRLPNELLRKNFRSAHFTIEKETSAVKTLLKDAANAAAAGQAQPDELLKQIDLMLTKMRGVKRKLAVYAAEESKLHDQVDARITHLEDLFNVNTIEDVKYEAWSRKRLDRLLADYLLRHNYHQSAVELARGKGMENLTDIDTFAGMSKIRDALLKGSVTEALAWCTDNKKELRKMESKLEFMLRFQQYIELIRTESPSKVLEAISHAKKHLVPYRTSFPREVAQACGLLAFPPKRNSTTSTTYESLYKRSRWQELAHLFTETHHQLLALPSVPLLYIALSSGLSALKTPACHSSTSHQYEGTSSLGHGVCPICSTELNELAKNVPYAHHTQSHVDNDLMLLPNGNAFGKQRLLDQARKASLGQDEIRDPRTGAIFHVSTLKKIYVT